VTQQHQNGPIFTRKRLQLDYNPRGQYLPIPRKPQLHKLVLLKGLGDGQKFADVFNGRRQLVSDIGCYVATWMPQRKFFVVTGILVLDFEFFIGVLIKSKEPVP
jgi:hypothetical protein